MAKIDNGVLTLQPFKKERFAILITGGDANLNGLADITVEIATDPPGPNPPHLGPFTKDLPVAEVLTVTHAAMTMLRVPGVAQSAVDQVIAALRAASRLP